MEKAEQKKKSRGLWWKIPLWTITGLVVTLFLAVTIALWILTPEKLTSLVNKHASEFLCDGEIRAGRVELTWWSSFPRFEIQVDSLSVKSTCVQIPDSAATLLALERLHGAMNLSALALGVIEIDDVTITRPDVCLYFGPDSISNLDIFPKSESEEDKADEPVSIPPLALNRFVIEGDAPLRYISEPDSTYIAVTLQLLSLKNQEPLYALNFNASPRTNLVELPDSFAIGLDGGIKWNPETPTILELHDFTAKAGEIAVTVNAAANLGEPPTLESLSLTTNEISPEYLVDLARRQPSLAEAIPAIQCGGKLQLKAELSAPYLLTDTLLPAVKADLTLGDGPFALSDMKLRLRNLGLSASVDIDPVNINKSTVTIHRLAATGDRGATSVALSGSATNLMADPKVDGNLHGDIELGQLPPALLKAIGAEMKGHLQADTDFRFHLSDLSAATFHRARLNGSARLRNFKINLPADTILAEARVAELKFGSSRSFTGDRGSVDSMLTVSVKVDTAAVSLTDLNASLSDLKIGFGCKNDASLTDTTSITPLGGVIELGQLRYVSTTDSVRAMMKDLKANAQIRRFKGDKKVPQLGMGLSVNRILYSQGIQRVTLGKSDIRIDMHLKAERQRTSPRQKQNRQQMHSDSLRVRRNNPGDQTEKLDLTVTDKGTASLLRRLELKGKLESRSGRIFSPFFPLRMSMRKLDMDFTTDSVNLNSLTIKVGQSCFQAKGSVDNIRRTLTSSRSRTPLGVKLSLHADTININELTQAAFRGSALAAKSDSVAMATMSQALDLNDDADLEQSVDSISVVDIAAILVPTNINADLRFSADNIIYSNMMMKDFTGTILVNNGAASLQNLHAATDLGSVNLNALYYAPTRSDIDFAMGLNLNRFRIARVIEIMPALDSIMPILGGISGIIDVNLGVTTKLDSVMNVELPSVHAMLNMTGDSLVVIDQQTYKTISKWLMFKDKHHNMIDHMDVELSVENSTLELYPFMFDFDRYRLGVMGHNDLALNLNYHVSVLKSPLPFKFGINITGPADDMKIRLGKARYKEKSAAKKVALADSTRINLVNEMRSAFRRGVDAARVAPLRVTRHERLEDVNAATDTLSATELQQLNQHQ